MRIPVTVALLLLCGFALAQEEPEQREITGTVTLEEQVIPSFGTATAQYVNIETQLAKEVFYGPAEIEAEIRDGYQVTSFSITLASKVSTKVKVELSHPDLLLTRENIDDYFLYRGTQQSINFVAFAPHSGTITILNKADDVLAVIPYVVRREDSLRQRVTGRVNTDGEVNMSYSLSSNSSIGRWGVGTSVQVDSDGNVVGSIKGTLAW